MFNNVLSSVGLRKEGQDMGDEAEIAASLQQQEELRTLGSPALLEITSIRLRHKETKVNV